MTQFAVDVLAVPETIAELTGTVMTFLESQRVDARATHHVAMIIEEFLTNLGTHGDCRDRPAHVRVTVEPTRVTGEIVDCGPPYDPRQARGPDPDLPVIDRPAGGLGLFLVRQLSSTLDYARRNEENHTQFAVARN